MAAVGRAASAAGEAQPAYATNGMQIPVASAVQPGAYGGQTARPAQYNVTGGVQPGAFEGPVQAAYKGGVPTARVQPATYAIGGVQSGGVAQQPTDTGAVHTAYTGGVQQRPAYVGAVQPAYAGALVPYASNGAPPASVKPAPSLWEKARARVYGEIEQRQLNGLSEKLMHCQLAAAILGECTAENKYQWYPSCCNKCGAAMVSAACTHTGGNAAKREIGGVTVSVNGARYTRGEINQGKLLLKTTCGNCKQKLEVVAADAVLVGGFAEVLAEAFREDAAKVLAAASAGLRQEQQGLFDKIMKLQYVTKAEKARAVSAPLIAHSNLGGVSCRVSQDVRATRGLVAGNVVRARLGRKTTTARKVGTVVAVPLAMIVGGVAMKMACGACCGGDDDNENHGGGPGNGGGSSGGVGGGAHQASDGNEAAQLQLENMRSAAKCKVMQGAASSLNSTAAFTREQAFDFRQVWSDNPQKLVHVQSSDAANLW